jgi:IS30 family transposase
MSQYTHLTIVDRENILVHHRQGKSINFIAKELNRSASTISRELKRNTENGKEYSACEAQAMYQKRRKRCVRKKKLSNLILLLKVAALFLGLQWSPEQISDRMKLEKSKYKISYNTIYRAIYAGMFNIFRLRKKYGFISAHRKLRHRGKRRKRGNIQETRGKISIINTIHDRPANADNRSEIGHWELDTLLGKLGSACLATSTDRKSRYLLVTKALEGRKASPMKDKLIEMFSSVPSNRVLTITPDCGKEFAEHMKVSEALHNVQFYFADPGSPWQRGTNENINGLLREYFPKGTDFNTVSDDAIDEAVSKINNRPLKCLNGLSPYEVFHGVRLKYCT